MSLFRKFQKSTLRCSIVEGQRFDMDLSLNLSKDDKATILDLLESAKTAVQGAIEVERRHQPTSSDTSPDIEASCRDCGLPYESFGADLVLGPAQWKALCPEGGLLCACCICRRAEKLGAVNLMASVSL